MAMIHFSGSVLTSLGSRLGGSESPDVSTSSQAGVDNNHQSLPRTSPPDGVRAAAQVVVLMLVLMFRTLPSANPAIMT
jgi:hypothetical protein